MNRMIFNLSRPTRSQFAVVHVIIAGRCYDNPYIRASIDISSDFLYPSVRERQDSCEYYGSTYFYCSSPSAGNYKWEVALLENVSFNLSLSNICCCDLVPSPWQSLLSLSLSLSLLSLILLLLQSRSQFLLIFVVVIIFAVVVFVIPLAIWLPVFASLCCCCYCYHYCCFSCSYYNVVPSIF